MNTEAGRYTIDIKFSTATGEVVSNYELDMGQSLPKQILRVRGYRIRTGGADSTAALANALALGTAYLDIKDSNGDSFFSKYHLIDSNINSLYFSLPLDDKIVTNRDSLNKVCYLSKTMTQKIYITVLGKTSETAGFFIPNYIKELYIDFETQTGTETNVRKNVGPKIII